MSVEFPPFLGGKPKYETLAKVPLSRAERRELRRPVPEQPLPPWLSAGDPPPVRATSEEAKQLAFVQFEIVLPRILERVCDGYTLNHAIDELRPLINVDRGAFMLWLKKQPKLHAMLKEAKEVRSEVWLGRMIDHATGKSETGENSMNEVSRDKLAVDTYKWIISNENRKDYGDVKSIQIDQTISVIGALDAARARVMQARTIDVDAVEVEQIRQLSAPLNFEEDDD